MICYQCQKPFNYIFSYRRCKKCTRLTVEELIGTEIPNPFPDVVDENESSEWTETPELYGE